MLLRQSWEDVRRCLIKEYPSQVKNIKGYKVVFYNLRKMKPETTDSRLMIIDVSGEESVINPDVFMLEKEDGDEEYTDYALSMIPWAKVIGLMIDENADTAVPELDAIAYALFKMTFFGFTERKIQRNFNELVGIKRIRKRSKFNKVDIWWKLEREEWKRKREQYTYEQQ